MKEKNNIAKHIAFCGVKNGDCVACLKKYSKCTG
jgi:hypothetical protein